MPKAKGLHAGNVAAHVYYILEIKAEGLHSGNVAAHIYYILEIVRL